MANGDAAVAAGMEVVPGTADRRMGYDEINKTRDYIAARTSTVTPIAKGGTGATTAPAARTALGVPSTSDLTNGLGAKLDASSISYIRNGGFNQITLQRQGDSLNLEAYIDVTPLGTVQWQGTGYSGPWVHTGDINSSTGYNRNVSGAGFRSAAFGADGRLGVTTSSRRFKRILANVEADPLAILEITPVLYQYLWAYAELGDAAFIEAGLIAEDLVEAGLDWLVFYDDEGKPFGIHYERVALAVLIATKYVWARHVELDARVSKLEGA